MRRTEPYFRTREWQRMSSFVSTTDSLIAAHGGRSKFRRSSSFIPLVAEFGANNQENWTTWQKLTMIMFIPRFIFFLIARIALIFWTKHIYSLGRFVFSILSSVLLIIGFLLLVWVRFINLTYNAMKNAVQNMSYTDYQASLYEKYCHANTYQEWTKYGKKLDDLSWPIRNWKAQVTSEHFDSEKLLHTMKRIKQLRDENDKENMCKLLLKCCQRQFCEIDNEFLYQSSHVGTKNIIQDYYQLIEENMSWVAKHGVFENLTTGASLNETKNEKLDFLFRCKKSIGRTALCLSGGGASALSHFGTVESLLKHDCLPKVISGTSAGSIVAAILCTWDDEKLRTGFDEVVETQVATKARFLPSLWEYIASFSNKGVFIDHKLFQKAMQEWIGDITFEEAYKKTNRRLNITVSYRATKKARQYSTFNKIRNQTSSNKHYHDFTTSSSKKSKSHSTHIKHAKEMKNRSILLNHITAPDVYIWSAVTASCAIPGIFQPQKLYRKVHPIATKASRESRAPSHVHVRPSVMSMSVQMKNINGTRDTSMAKLKEAQSFKEQQRSEIGAICSNYYNASDCELDDYFFDNGIEFMDGSVASDIPFAPLSELFRVNYFIVAQANPHINPLLLYGNSMSTVQKASHINGNYFDFNASDPNDHFSITQAIDEMAYDLVLNQIRNLEDLDIIPQILGCSFHSIVAQKYTGDITILPKLPMMMRLKVMSHPSNDELKQYLKVGRNATFEHINRIRNVLKIEKIIDKLVYDTQSLQNENEETVEQGENVDNRRTTM